MLVMKMSMPARVILIILRGSALRRKRFSMKLWAFTG
jgi:hypothetical protein